MPIPLSVSKQIFDRNDKFYGNLFKLLAVK